MLYFRGCTAREKDKDIEDATRFLLDESGLEYHILDNEKCCGSVLLRSGFKNDAFNLMKENLNDFKDELIITSCAGCYKTLKEDYKDLFNVDLNVLHISQLLFQLIKDGKIEVNDNFTNFNVTYHDPCHLGRALKVYDEPREIIKKYANLLEMKNIKDKGLCCGSGGGVKSAYPDISNIIAKRRIKEAEETGCDYILTTCPFCKLNLNQNSDKLKVLDLSEFIAKSIKNENIEGI